jgi:hypothetical protein
VPARYRAPGFDRDVGAVDLAVAVDVLRGEVPCLAVGVVGDAEGEGAGAADGGDPRRSAFVYEVCVGGSG